MDVRESAAPHARSQLENELAFEPDVSIVEGTLFVTGSLGLLSLSVNGSEPPTEVAEFLIPNSGWAVAVGSETAYLSDGIGVIRAYDMRDPQFPVETHQLGNSEYVVASKLAVRGDIVVASAGADIWIMSDELEPIASLSGTADIETLGLRDHHALVGTHMDGLHVYDYADPSRPVEVAFVELVQELPSGRSVHSSRLDMAMVGDYLYLADGLPGGFHVISIRDAADPHVVNYVRTRFDRLSVIAGDGSRLFVCFTDGELWTYDVGDPLRPRQLSVSRHIQLVGVRDIVVRDGSLFAATRDNGLVRVDVSELSAARIVGQAVTVPEAHDLDIAGGHVFVAAEGDALAIVRVVAPGRLFIPFASSIGRGLE